MGGGLVKRKILALVFVSLLTAAASAADLATVVRQVDAQAQVQKDGFDYIVITSAQRVTPHDPSYTSIVKALCAQPDVLEDIDRMIVLNSHAFKGVMFWHYDDHDDLAGACKAIGAGTPAAAFAVMH